METKTGNVAVAIADFHYLIFNLDCSFTDNLESRNYLLVDYIHSS